MGSLYAMQDSQRAELTLINGLKSKLHYTVVVAMPAGSSCEIPGQDPITIKTERKLSITGSINANVKADLFKKENFILLVFRSVRKPVSPMIALWLHGEMYNRQITEFGRYRVSENDKRVLEVEQLPPLITSTASSDLLINNDSWTAKCPFVISAEAVASACGAPRATEEVEI